MIAADRNGPRHESVSRSIATFADRLTSGAAFAALRGAPSGAGMAVRSLPIAAAAWVFDLLAGDRARPLLVVVPREADALAWVEAARLFSPYPEETLFLPSPALSPYQEAPPSLPVLAQESLALDLLARSSRPSLVVTPRALFRRFPPAAEYAARVVEVGAGAVCDPLDLALRLVRAGYRRAELVAEVGAFALRGGVLDVFPPGEDEPLRLDFFGDTVESLRRFDVTSQRSGAVIATTTRLRPVSLFETQADTAAALARVLDDSAEAWGREAAQRIQRLEQTETFPGWENLLPLLQTTIGLHDYLGDALVVIADPETLLVEVARHADLLENEFLARRRDGRLAVEPELLELPRRDVEALLAAADFRLGEVGRGSAVDFFATSSDRFVGQLPRFPREIESATARGDRVLIVSPVEHHDRLAELLSAREIDVERDLLLLPGDLRRGFRLPAAGVVLFGEAQLFLHRGSVGSRRPSSLRTFFGGLRDLKIGDFVVHQDHGIGRFVGLRSVAEQSTAGPLPEVLRGVVRAVPSFEVMEIEYAGARTLLVPLHRANEIERYAGLEGSTPRLDQLGGASWNKRKARVQRGLRRLAVDLLRLYAERELATAPQAASDSDAQGQFEAAFEFEETADQLAASLQIKGDLEKKRPMDRLLVGDVGFGKTEVAMRAAFKMIDNGYQVVVLTPTTILADQHWDTFRERFRGFPATIEMVSRFRSNIEIRDVKKRLAEGKVDLVIGTHGLLAKDVVLPRLGLVIVDEEQRFGVAHKERLKEIRGNVHMLAMSATPIPRSLQLSLASVRDLSTIESPPKDRLAVETRIMPLEPELVREAIEFELERGGQIYYVYNRVEDIETVARMLLELVPRVRITIGHGQLEERELSRRMHAFAAGEYDLLLATTIIENGIDIPNVNTMLVHRADRFGLAQLYQLRGRVGRSDQLAFCYLLVPADQVLQEDARKRLLTIEEFSDLGAGFRIAARDLEIRGAGSLLGAEQSGHIAELGVETYLKMLEETVRELRGELTEGISVSLDLPIVATIPIEYVSDGNSRIELYRRFAGEEESDALLEELRDRFGPVPEPVRTLAAASNLRRLAERVRVQAISAQKGELSIRLRRDARVDVDKLVALVAERDDLRFSPEGVLTVERVSGADVVAVARHLLQAIKRVDDASPGAGEVSS